MIGVPALRTSRRKELTVLYEHWTMLEGGLEVLDIGPAVGPGKGIYYCYYYNPIFGFISAANFTNQCRWETG